MKNIVLSQMYCTEEGCGMTGAANIKCAPFANITLVQIMAETVCLVILAQDQIKLTVCLVILVLDQKKVSIKYLSKHKVNKHRCARTRRKV